MIFPATLICTTLATTPPNVVIIFTDDQGYADVGCYGAVGYETPNLDALADGGMRFTDFHVAQAVCSASRAALMTGCYSNRVGVLGAYMPWAKQGLHPNETTIAEVVKARGYATACIGKWHLGHHPEFLPTAQGFDEYFGIPYSNDMWPVDFDGTPVPEDHRKFRYPPLPLLDGLEVIETIDTLGEQDMLTTRYTERAVEFIGEHVHEPFFLYVPHSMPHVPLGVSDKFRGKSEQGMYGDVMMEIDWSVGEIVGALDAHGLRGNTLVVFASDNGPWLNFGNHGGSAEPLREGKGNMWEGGARVPCIMNWPGRIPAASTCTSLAATIDILPTIAELTGAALPERVIDGVSIVPVFTDPETAPRSAFCYYYGRKLCAVREGRWKLMLPHDYRSYAGVEPKHDGYPGPYSRGHAELALYDLDADVGERTDVKDRHPAIVARLMILAERARKELGDGERKGAGVRPVGRAEEAVEKPATPDPA